MGIVEKIIPRQANNDYRGSPLAFYVLCAFAVLFTGRSLIHYFKHDGGANSIASIVTFPGTPDPDTVIYLAFSLWGAGDVLAIPTGTKIGKEVKSAEPFTGVEHAV